jgi:hypothetical protein
MISRVQLSQAPLNLGEFRELQAWSDRPMSVSIECFVEPPTPAQLNACNECGSFPLASGQVLRFTAPSELFAQGRGYMKISVSDASGPQQSYTLPVATAGAQGLTESYKNAVTLATEKLREAIDRLDKRVKELGEVIKKREKLAKILKGATVLIGIFVATGFLPQVVVQILGVVVLIVVGFDQTYANLAKLRTFTSGRNTYLRIRREIVNIHNDQIIDVVKKRGDVPKEAAEMLINLNKQLMNQLAKVEQEVEMAIDNQQFALMERLSLEEQGKK